MLGVALLAGVVKVIDALGEVETESSSVTLPAAAAAAAAPEDIAARRLRGKTSGTRGAYHGLRYHEKAAEVFGQAKCCGVTTMVM